MNGNSNDTTELGIRQKHLKTILMCKDLYREIEEYTNYINEKVKLENEYLNRIFSLEKEIEELKKVTVKEKDLADVLNSECSNFKEARLTLIPQFNIGDFCTIIDYPIEDKTSIFIVRINKIIITINDVNNIDHISYEVVYRSKITNEIKTTLVKEHRLILMNDPIKDLENTEDNILINESPTKIIKKTQVVVTSILV